MEYKRFHAVEEPDPGPRLELQVRRLVRAVGERPVVGKASLVHLLVVAPIIIGVFEDVDGVGGGLARRHPQQVRHARIAGVEGFDKPARVGGFAAVVDDAEVLAGHLGLGDKGEKQDERGHFDPVIVAREPWRG